MNKLTLVLILLVTVITNAHANFKPFPGYYIKNSGDTVYCDFQFTDWKLNPKTVTVYNEGKTVKLSPDDIKGFGVTDFGDYISASVSYYKGYLKGLNMPEEYSDTIIKSKVFLKRLIDGPYSLYQLNVPERLYYFSSDRKDPPVELVYRIRQKNMQVEEDQRFRNKLFEYLSKEGISHEYSTRVSNTNYEAKGIGVIIRALNKKAGSLVNKKKKDELINGDIFIGVLHNSFPSEFNGGYISSIKLDPSTTISGGLNFTYFVPANFHRFAVGVSAGYNSYSSSYSQSDSIPVYNSVNYYYTTYYDEEVYIKNSLVMINLYGMYVINPLDKFKFYGKAGVNANISLKKDAGPRTKYRAETIGIRNGNEPTYNLQEGDRSLMEVRRMYYTVNVNAGMMSGRHKVELAYYPPINLNRAFKIATAGLYYYYTVFK